MTTTEKPTYTIEDIAEAVEQFAASLNAFVGQVHASLDALTPETEETETVPAWPDAPLIRVKAATHCGDPIAIAPEGVLALRDLVASDYNAADGRILIEDTDEIADWEPVSLLDDTLTYTQLSALPVGSQVVDHEGRIWTLTLKGLGRWMPSIAPWTPDEDDGLDVSEVMVYSPLTLVRDASKDHR